MSASCDVVVGPCPDIICFSNIAYNVTVIAHLIIDGILAVTVCMAFYFPSAPSCGKRFAFLEVHFAYVTAGSFAVEYTIIFRFVFCNEFSIGDLGQNIWGLPASMDEFDVLENLLYSWIL